MPQRSTYHGAAANAAIHHCGMHRREAFSAVEMPLGFRACLCPMPIIIFASRSTHHALVVSIAFWHSPLSNKAFFPQLATVTHRPFFQIDLDYIFLTRQLPAAAQFIWIRQISQPQLMLDDRSKSGWPPSHCRYRPSHAKHQRQSKESKFQPCSRRDAEPSLP